MRMYVILLFIVIGFSSCKKKPPKSTPVIEEKALGLGTTFIDSIPVKELKPRSHLHLKEVLPSESISIAMPYATKDNFTDLIIYECPVCFVSDTLHHKLIRAAHNIYANYGYKIKLLDCYRPLPAQKKLWDIVPNPTYVTNPSKGSMHNRGMAIDLTLVDSLGNDLDMGSAFDHFGRAAHIDNYNHSKEVLKNRSILSQTMASFGFKGIRTEWWHYSIRSPFYPIMSWEWDCE